MIMKEEQRDLQVELKKFIAGASQSSKSSPIELTKTALYLLKYLPSARDAVLEYFNGLFDLSLERHIALVSKSKLQVSSIYLSQTTKKRR